MVSNSSVYYIPNPTQSDHDPREPAKRIILICDGTWNDATALETNGPIWTNPQRLAACIKPFDESANMAQCVIYLRGVGTTTSWSLNKWEAMMGGSMKESILLGYYQVCLNWNSHADEILLVGFSRGGYVAKALARLLGDLGVKKFHWTPQAMDETWKQWQQLCEEGGSLSMADVMRRGTHCGGIKVQACLTWDTVKAEGMFGKELSFLPDERVADCATVRHSYHALSLNEHRRSFKPILWTTRKRHSTDVLKQCWFLGHHSDVGGASCLTAANITLAWMVAQVRNQGKQLLALDLHGVDNFKSLQHSISSEKKLGLVDPMTGSLYNQSWWILGSKKRVPGETLRDQTTHESIHWTVHMVKRRGGLPTGVCDPLADSGRYEFSEEHRIWKFQQELEIPEEAPTEEEKKIYGLRGQSDNPRAVASQNSTPVDDS